MKSWPSLLVLLALSFLPVSSPAEELRIPRPTVLVLVRAGTGGEVGDLRLLILDAIRLELADRGLVMVAPGKAQPGEPDIPQVARQYAADFVVTGTYDLSDSSVDLALQWYRPSGGAAVAKAVRKGPLDFAFDTLVAGAVDQLVAGQTAEIRQVATTKAEAERIAAEQRAEQARRAAEKAAAERAGAEKATADALAVAEAQRVAAEEARIAAEKAAAEAAEKAAAESEAAARAAAGKEAAERKAAEALAAAEADRSAAQRAAAELAAAQNARPQVVVVPSAPAAEAGLVRLPPVKPLGVTVGGAAMVQTFAGELVFHGLGVKAPLVMGWRFGLKAGYVGVGLASGLERFQVDGARGSVLCTIIPFGAQLSYGTRTPGSIDFFLTASGGPAVLLYEKIGSGSSVATVIPFVSGGGGLVLGIFANLALSVDVGYEAIFAADALFLVLEPSLSLLLRF
jgi:hypothetical protein